MRWLSVLLLASSTGCGDGIFGAPEAPPNIVVLLADDLRYDCLGCNGNDVILTPNIDRLAAEGVAFDNAFATTANCVTSRANLMTGQYAARTGWRYGELEGRSLTPEQLAITYPGILREGGYRIGYVGKYHLGRPPEDFFDFDAAYEGQGRYVDPTLPEHLTAHTATRAEEAIEELSVGEGPFLLTVGFKAPHAQDGKRPPFYPYNAKHVQQLYADVVFPPPPLGDAAFFAALPEFIRSPVYMNRRRWEWRLGSPALYQQSVKGYYRLVSDMDIAIGRILRTLEDLALTEETVVVFTSDHGVFLGQRGLAGKWLAHEPSIRIPLIVADPRLPAEQRGTRRAQMALSIDVAPTLLDLAGVDAGDRIQGASLVPILRGETPDDWRSEFYYEHRFRPDRFPASEAVRTERWKYIRYVDRDPPVEELYDLDADPLEAHNLAGVAAHAGELTALREKLDGWRERAR